MTPKTHEHIFLQLPKRQSLGISEFGLQAMKAAGLSTLITGVLGLAMLAPVVLLLGVAGAWRGMLAISVTPFAVSLVGTIILTMLVLIPATLVLARLLHERTWHYVLLAIAGGGSIPPTFLWLMDWQFFSYWEAEAAPVFAAFGGLAGAIAGNSWGSWRTQRQNVAPSQASNPIHDLIY